MSYSLSTYTVRITSSSQLQVISRAESTVQQTIDLTQTDGKIFLVDEDDFEVIGVSDTDGEYVNQVPPSNNDVSLTTGAELININGASIELETMNAYLCKNGEGAICFYEASVEEASNSKAA